MNIQEARAALAGIDMSQVRFACSISGGKDSAATGLFLRELGIEYESIFCDTGWEHPDTYIYLREILPPVLGPIRWLTSKHGGMIEHIRRKAMFPSRVRRWCTEELKAFPARDFFREIIAEELANASPRWIVNVTGIRAAESRSRGKLPEWERWGADGRGDLPILVWRPILRWSENDVIAIHKRHGLAPNPLYLRGASRVGCWPCIHARKSEIALVAREDPERIELIRAMESELTEKARARAASRMLEPWPESLPTPEEARSYIENAEAEADALRAPWSAVLAPGEVYPFVGQTGHMRIATVVRAIQEATELLELAERESEMRVPDHWRQTRTYFGIGEKFRDEVSWIDRVVEWSRTDRGGRQFQLFEDPSEGARDGCMRWGMCETGGKDDVGG